LCSGGRLQYDGHDVNTSKPVHIVFQNTDYDDFTENEELVDIYLWKPEEAYAVESTLMH